MIVQVACSAASAPHLVGSHGPIVVIDALRMSATVIVALHLGIEVIPVPTAEEALALKHAETSASRVLTAGERGGRKITELDLGNSPSELLHQRRLNSEPSKRENPSGELLALTTSNGVPALLAVADHPGAVLIGSPLNLTALVERIKAEDPRELSILLSGREGQVAQEDAMTASLLLDRLGESTQSDPTQLQPTAAILPPPIALSELEEFFMETQSARCLISLGYEEDVRLCSKVDCYPIVPELRAGRLTL